MPKSILKDSGLQVNSASVTVPKMSEEMDKLKNTKEIISEVTEKTSVIEADKKTSKKTPRLVSILEMECKKRNKALYATLTGEDHSATKQHDLKSANESPAVITALSFPNNNTENDDDAPFKGEPEDKLPRYRRFNTNGPCFFAYHAARIQAVNARMRLLPLRREESASRKQLPPVYIHDGYLFPKSG